MIKQDVTFTDYFGETVTETLYFNFTTKELIDLEMSVEGGLSNVLKAISKTSEPRKVIELFDMFILKSYGKRSDDGRRFIKSEELVEEFKSSLAYEAFHLKLLTDANFASEFVNGLIPAEVAKMAQERKESNANLSSLIEDPQSTNNPRPIVNESLYKNQSAAPEPTPEQISEFIRNNNLNPRDMS